MAIVVLRHFNTVLITGSYIFPQAVKGLALSGLETPLHKRRSVPRYVINSALRIYQHNEGFGMPADESQLTFLPGKHKYR